MEGRGQIPSQSHNYVTILHLRERWLKENDRIQKEKEEQEQLQQLKVQPTGPTVTHDRKPVFWSRNGSGKFPKFYRAVPVSNPRDVKETCKKAEGKGEPQLTVSRIEKDEEEPFKKTEEEGEPPLAVPAGNPRYVKGTCKKTEYRGEPPLAAPRYCRSVPASNPRNVKETCKKTEDEGEPPLTVPRIENDEKKACKKTENEGEPPLAIPRIEKDEKKKNTRKNGRKKNPRSQNEEMDRTSRRPKETWKEEMRELECEVGAQNGKKNVRARTIYEKKGNLKENPRAQNEDMERTSRTPDENLKKEMRETECEVRVGKNNVRAKTIHEKKGILKENPRAQNEEMVRTLQAPDDNLKKEMGETERQIRVGKKNARARSIHEKKGILKENPRAQNEEMDRTLQAPDENLKKEMGETEREIRVGKKNVRARRIHEKKGILKENPRAQNEEIDRTLQAPDENLKKEMGEMEREIRVGKKNVKARRIHEKKGILKENPRAQNEEMDRTLQAPDENLKKEMRETERGVRVGKKNARARSIHEKKRMESQCGPETGYTPEMENKLGCISVNFETRREKNNGVYRGSSQGNWNLHRLAPPYKQRDVGMIWVRKDEISKGA